MKTLKLHGSSFICNRCGSSAGDRHNGRDGGEYCVNCVIPADAEYKASRGIRHMMEKNPRKIRQN